MTTIAITKTGKFAFVKDNRGGLMLDDGIKEVADLIRSQLSVFKRSYILDTDYGIDLNLSDIEIRDEVVSLILGVPNVEGIKNLLININRDTNTFEVSAVVTTTMGILRI